MKNSQNSQSIMSEKLEAWLPLGVSVFDKESEL